jgi:PucR family transcriptional regulator, purine catabolism regulatory protein
MSGISVRQLIEHKPFLFGKEPVISGGSGLDRKITNVNVMEVPDVFNWVRQGDLLLTTAYSIKDNPAAQHELIPKLSETGIAAIGIKTKRYLEKVPQGMIDLSNEYRLPILELAYQIGYSQTISEVLEEVLSQKALWIVDQHQKIQLLTQTLIMGENYRTFIETFAKCTGLQAALITFQSELISTDAAAAIEWPEAAQLLSAELPAQVPFPCYVRNGDPAKLYMPIERNIETMAFFVCWGRDREAWEPLLLLLHHAIGLLTLQISKQQSLNSLEDNRKDLFLKSWILGEVTDAKLIDLHAASNGLHLQPDYSVCLTSRLSPYTSKELMRAKTYCILNGIILLNLGNEWVLLVPRHLADQAGFYNRLLAELESFLKMSSLRLGISPVKTVSNVHEGYNQALSSLELWEVVQPTEVLCYYDKLGVYPLVSHLSNQEPIKEQLFSYIQPLHEYDRKNNSKLIETLIAYLQCGGNIKETAQILFCHYNSIVYRIERIQQLMHMDLKDPEVRFQLQMAVKVFDFSLKRNKLRHS